MWILLLFKTLRLYAIQMLPTHHRIKFCSSDRTPYLQNIAKAVSWLKVKSLLTHFKQQKLIAHAKNFSLVCLEPCELMYTRNLETSSPVQPRQREWEQFSIFLVIILLNKQCDVISLQTQECFLKILRRFFLVVTKHGKRFTCPCWNNTLYSVEITHFTVFYTKCVNYFAHF